MVVCKFAGCNQVYNDARFLPCGKRTCAAHIDTMLVKSDNINSGSDSKIIKCTFCGEIHTFPENGKEFPVDEYIPLLLNMHLCSEHDAAKKSFNDVSQLLLDKLLKFDKEDIAIDYFERVEADILLEKEVNLQKLLTHYQKLVDDVHKRKAQCLSNLKTDKPLESEFEAIKQTLAKHANKLKTENLNFRLKTLDGDDGTWKEIQSQCNTMLEKIKSLEKDLNERIMGDQMIGFRPSISNVLLDDTFGHLDQRIIDSTIISNYTMENNLIGLCKLSGKQLKLLNRASRDGFETASFHAKCENQPRTYYQGIYIRCHYYR